MAVNTRYEKSEKQRVRQNGALWTISKLHEIFKLFGTDSETNINIIVQHACELLKGVCCLYNRLDTKEHSLTAWAYSNLPSDFNRNDTPYGHICYEVTMNEQYKPVVIGDIGNTIYNDTDPNVKKYGLKSYLSFPVLVGGNTIGALCIVDVKEREFSEIETHIISTLAKAVSFEEERNHAEETLRNIEEKYQNLTGKLDDITWTTDLALRPTYISPFIEKKLGFKQEEWLRRNPELQMTPDSYDRITQSGG